VAASAGADGSAATAATVAAAAAPSDAVVRGAAETCRYGRQPAGLWLREHPALLLLLLLLL
jgi:hypothetical protein